MKRYYSNYKGSKHKWIKKVLIVLSVCAAAFALSILLGMYLKSSLENAPINTEPVETDNIPPSPSDQNIYDSLKSKSKTLPGSVIGGCVNTSATDAAAEFAAVFKEYGAISFTATDKSGKISYGSPAVADISKTTVNSTLIQADAIRSVLASQGGYHSAVYKSDSDVIEGNSVLREIDCAVVGELDSMGFDDVIITGTLTDRTLDSETVKKLLSYIASLRESAQSIMIGVEVPLSILVDPECAPQTVLLSEHVDFLAVDLTEASEKEDPTAYLRTTADNIRGSFSAYRLRALIDGGEKAAADAALQALRDVSVNYIQFITPVIPDPATSDPASSDPADSASSDPSSSDVQ